MLWQDGDQVIAYRQKAIVIFTKGDMVGIENVMHKVQDEICIKRVLWSSHPQLDFVISKTQ